MTNIVTRQPVSVRQKKITVVIFSVICVFWVGSVLAAGSDDTFNERNESVESFEAIKTDANSTEDLLEMSLEELMEVPVVVSSSRQSQKINKTSAPISIVTAEDIHYSGLTNIPENLQYVPGIDIVRFNRNLYGVGVHGMHETVSNHLLSLVDGRFANNPIFGGPEFHRLPVFIEDIDHIEVVRGPGGAAWGANAYTGVVNIITKDVGDTLGYFGSTTITEFGDTFTHLRWGAKQGDWSWRFSAGYEDTVDSDDAGAGRFMTTSPSLIGPPLDYIGYSGYVARDFSRNSRFDSKAVYRLSDTTKVSLGAGYSHIISGDFEIAGLNLFQNNRSELLRMFTKIEHEFDDGSSGYVQWFGNLSNMNWINVARYDVIENDIEAQLNFAPVDGHHITIGGNFRWDKIKIRGFGQLVYPALEPQWGYYWYPGAPYDENWAGFFAMDRWDVTNRLTLEAQIRGDWYSEVSTDWSNRFTALYDLDGEDRHTLRFSVAKAFRSPLISLRKLYARTVPIGGGWYALNINGNEELKNEETWAVEAGYTGILSDKLTLSVNTFYQRLSGLIGYAVSGPSWAQTYTPDNIDGADMCGGEIELAYKDEEKELSAWYAYNDFELDSHQQQIRAYPPVENKFGLTGRLFLDDGWVFNTNYKISGTTPKNPHFASDEASIGGYHRLDITLSKTFAKGHGELMFGVSDLFNKTNEAVGETITVSGHETPGRTFFGRLQLKF